MRNLFDAMSRTNIMNKLDTNILTDPNLTYSVIEHELLEKINTFLPTKKVKFNKYKHKKSEWITTDILKSIRTRDDLYRKWKSKIPGGRDYDKLKSDFKDYS